MVTVGNKIETFTQIVMDKLNSAYDAKLAELEVQNETALKAYEGVAQEKANQYVAGFEAEGRRDAKMIVSKAKTLVRNKHIETRQEIYKSLEKGLKEAIADFTNGESYKDYLKDSVEKAIKEIRKYDGIVLEMTKVDYDRHRSLVEDILKDNQIDLATVNYTIVEKGMLGGIIFYNQDHIVRMDYSLDAKLEENSRVLGILLSELLDEAGE